MSFVTQLKLRVDWSELDIFGHVNNVAFHKYAQSGRLEFAEAVGLMELYRKEHVGFMVAETNCQFKKELLFPGNITIATQAVFVKNTSFGLQHKMTDDLGAIVAIATDVLVVFDFNTHEKCLIPEQIKANISL